MTDKRVLEVSIVEHAHDAGAPAVAAARVLGLVMDGRLTCSAGIGTDWQWERHCHCWWLRSSWRRWGATLSQSAARTAQTTCECNQMSSFGEEPVSLWTERRCSAGWSVSGQRGRLDATEHISTACFRCDWSALFAVDLESHPVVSYSVSLAVYCSLLFALTCFDRSR